MFWRRKKYIKPRSGDTWTDGHSVVKVLDVNVSRGVVVYSVVGTDRVVGSEEAFFLSSFKKCI
jgi:hypothetical protein